ncbi:Major facilitator superfamily [Neofusicoccum parvum]|uniref:Major facilitator superfamily n=1 Tax=Neofusicoccum parvum TaxID=310453 RepID=A0ACB5SQM1_9PEZI|nr:Major facilitator superfamily [Neofusicoccum parvum]
MPFTLTEKTGVDPGAVQHWNSILIAVYGAALLAFSPICGYVADHTSTRRMPLLLGLAALAGSTVMLNIGSSMAVLVAGRLLQGTSAAVVWVVGLALLVDTVGQNDVGQAMGYVSLAMSLAVLLAPLLGGVVLDHAGYNAVFAMAYALIGLDIVLRLVLVEKKVARRWEPPGEVADLGASSTAAASYGATTAVAAQPPLPDSECKDDDDDDDEKKSTTLPTAPDPAHVQDPEKATAAPSIAVQPSPSTTPTTPPPPPHPSSRYRLPPTLSLLTSRRLLTALLGTLTVSILMSSLDAVLPLHVRHTFSWPATGAGLIFLPIVIPSFAAPLFGRAADRASPRLPTALGFLGSCACFALLRLVARDSLRQKALLCALLALLGLSLAAVMPCVMAEISHVVAAKEGARPGLFGRKGAYAQAYGLFNMAWAGGALVGPIWAGYVRDGAGWGAMGWSLGLLAGVTAVPAALWTGGWVGGKGGRGAGDEESGGR